MWHFEYHRKYLSSRTPTPTTSYNKASSHLYNTCLFCIYWCLINVLMITRKCPNYVIKMTLYVNKGYQHYVRKHEGREEMCQIFEPIPTYKKFSRKNHATGNCQYCLHDCSLSRNELFISGWIKLRSRNFMCSTTYWKEYVSNIDYMEQSWKSEIHLLETLSKHVSMCEQICSKYCL